MFKSIIMLFLMSVSSLIQAAEISDPIQHCLDIRRLVDAKFKKKMMEPGPDRLHFTFHPVSASAIPMVQPKGNMNEIIQALNHQIANCKRKNHELQAISIAGKRYTRDEWCLDTNSQMLTFAQAAHGDVQQYFASIKNEFDWYQSDGWPVAHSGFKKHDFQFTAYYAPAAVEGSKVANGAYRYPLYSNPGVVHVPSERKKLGLKGPLCGKDPLSQVERPYCMKNAQGEYSIAPDRREIEQGALSSKYIIAYVKNPNDPAFIMLQGSGSLKLDGSLYHINFSGTNGRPRTMLGRLVQCAQDPTCGGNIEEIKRCAEDHNCHDENKLRCNLSKEIRLSSASEQRIRHYLDAPAQRNIAQDLRSRDQSYVFFKKETGGPYGSENIPITPHASCATDHQLIPVGMNFIYTVKNTTSWCVAQDSGGAIIGAHVDCYKGEGDVAEAEANAVNHAGSLYIALPKHAKS